MISAAVHELIEEVACIGAGERATAPIPEGLTDTLATMAGRVAGSLPDERLACPWLLSALTAAYHLGRQHTMEQVAFGLGAEEGPRLRSVTVCPDQCQWEPGWDYHCDDCCHPDLPANQE